MTKMKVLVLVLDHEVLDLNIWSWNLGICLEEKVLQFFKTFVVILDGSEQRTPWHFVRDNKSSFHSEAIVSENLLRSMHISLS